MDMHHATVCVQSTLHATQTNITMESKHSVLDKLIKLVKVHLVLHKPSERNYKNNAVKENVWKLALKKVMKMNRVSMVTKMKIFLSDSSVIEIPFKRPCLQVVSEGNNPLKRHKNEP
jgi:hypothetical protein